MRHARSDYNGIQDSSGHIPEDEPVFLIRAQDITAGPIVRFWAILAQEAGVDQEMIDAAYAWADQMTIYALAQKVVKVPDAPPGVFQK